MLDIIQNLPYINLFTEALPFIILLLFLKRIKTNDKRVFFLYALLTTILVVLVILVRYIYNAKPTYFVIARVHTVIEFLLLTQIFYLIIKNTLVKKAVRIASILFFVLCLYDYISSKTAGIAFVPLLTECIFFIILIVYFFFEKIKQDANEPLFQTFIFWFAVAFLLNFSGNFLLFVYSETSNKDADFKTNYTIIYSTVTIIKNLLLCIAVTIKENVTPNKNINITPNDDTLFFTPDKRDSLLT